MRSSRPKRRVQINNNIKQYRNLCKKENNINDFARSNRAYDRCFFGPMTAPTQALRPLKCQNQFKLVCKTSMTTPPTTPSFPRLTCHRFHSICLPSAPLRIGVSNFQLSMHARTPQLPKMSMAMAKMLPQPQPEPEPGQTQSQSYSRSWSEN